MRRYSSSTSEFDVDKVVKRCTFVSIEIFPAQHHRASECIYTASVLDKLDLCIPLTLYTHSYTDSIMNIYTQWLADLETCIKERERGVG